MRHYSIESKRVANHIISSWDELKNQYSMGDMQLNSATYHYDK